MNVTLYITSDAMQVNLLPETEHEKTMLAALSEYRGPATIGQGRDISPCAGGWLRDFGDKALATTITIQRFPEKSAVGLSGGEREAVL